MQTIQLARYSANLIKTFFSRFQHRERGERGEGERGRGREGGGEGRRARELNDGADTFALVVFLWMVNAFQVTKMLIDVDIDIDTFDNSERQN